MSSHLRSPLPLALALLLALALAPAARAVELLQAELVAGGHPALENGSGSIRLEASRLGPPAPPVFVPEPGALLQLGAGAGLLMLLARRRRGRAAARAILHANSSDPASDHEASR